MLILTQALEDAERVGAGGDAASTERDGKEAAESARPLLDAAAGEAAASSASQEGGNGKDAEITVPSPGSYDAGEESTLAATAAAFAWAGGGEDGSAFASSEGVAVLAGDASGPPLAAAAAEGGRSARETVEGAPGAVISGGGGGREEGMVLELPDDHGEMVSIPFAPRCVPTCALFRRLAA